MNSASTLTLVAAGKNRGRSALRSALSALLGTKARIALSHESFAAAMPPAFPYCPCTWEDLLIAGNMEQIEVEVTPSNIFVQRVTRHGGAVPAAPAPVPDPQPRSAPLVSTPRESVAQPKWEHPHRLAREARRIQDLLAKCELHISITQAIHLTLAGRGTQLPDPETCARLAQIHQQEHKQQGLTIPTFQEALKAVTERFRGGTKSTE